MLLSSLIGFKLTYKERPDETLQVLQDPARFHRTAHAV